MIHLIRYYCPDKVQMNLLMQELYLPFFFNPSRTPASGLLNMHRFFFFFLDTITPQISDRAPDKNLQVNYGFDIPERPTDNCPSRMFGYFLMCAPVQLIIRSNF